MRRRSLVVVGILFIDVMYLHALAALAAYTASPIMRDQNFGG